MLFAKRNSRVQMSKPTYQPSTESTTSFLAKHRLQLVVNATDFLLLNLEQWVKRNEKLRKSHLNCMFIIIWLMFQVKLNHYREL